MTTLTNRLQTIHDRIRRACEKAERDPSTVTLVAISKTKPATLLKEAFDAGQVVFGENYVQEFLDKQEALSPLVEQGLTWHFTGHLQRNKVRKIAGRTHLIHSVGSMSLAEELEKRTPQDQSQPILLQCNVSGEQSKSGFERREDVLSVLRHPWERLEIQGLMALPAWFPDPEMTRPSLRKLRHWREELEASSGLSLPHLSMGMSHDLEIAVEEGATLVRVGTAIFGPREK